MKYKVLLLSTLLLSACDAKGPAWDKIHWQPAQVSRSDKDILIPRPLAEIIADQFSHSKKSKEEGTEMSGHENHALIPRRYLGVELFLVPKTEGVLPEPLKFSLPRGGGVIDFSEWIPERINGSFYLKFSVLAEGAEEGWRDHLKVYFLSRSRRRQVSDQEMGSGCNKYMDLTKYYHDTLSRSGIKANTTDQRHLSLLSGTFYFVYPSHEALHLASLTFEDPRYPEVQCSL